MRKTIFTAALMAAAIVGAQAQYRIVIDTEDGRSTFSTDEIQKLTFGNGTFVYTPMSGLETTFPSYEKITFVRESWNFNSFSADTEAAVASLATTDVDGNAVAWSLNSTGRYDAAGSTDAYQLGIAETAGLVFSGKPRINLSASGKKGIQGSMSIQVPVYEGQTVTVSYSNTGSSNGDRYLMIDGDEVGDATASTKAISYTYTVPVGTDYITLSSKGLIYYSITTTAPDTAPGTVAKPTMSFDNQSGTVSIACATEGAAITYSLDPDQTATATAYSQPFELTEATVVYAKATATDLVDSDIATLSVRKVATPTGAQLVNSNRVMFSCSTTSATIYYSVDGGANWTSGKSYNLTSDAVTTIQLKAQLDGYITSDIYTVENLVFDENNINSLAITNVGGWYEAAYVEWEIYDGATGYNVYVKGGQYADYTKLDAPLVRNYGTYGRADAVGLKAATDYSLMVVPVINDVELTDAASEATGIEVVNYDRSGFAHMNNANAVGAYNDDGTLKPNAVVLYITNDNVNTIQFDVTTDASGVEVGLGNILAAFEKDKETRPFVIRFIGQIKDISSDQLMGEGSSLQLKGKNGLGSNTTVTFEGIGEDATLYGFGLCINKTDNVEVRNLATMLFADDGIQLKTGCHTWIHHVDFFYGKKGGDGDQAKGDGSLDTKDKGTYNTFSYNHFWDSGKSSLCGMKSEATDCYESYHHNWFDHSDSRHPRVRTKSVHVYNNYYDGTAKYGVGATMGSSVFVENNYFRHSKYPMLASKQGSDAKGEGTFSGENGGMIKSYGNIYAETGSASSYLPITHTTSATDFDCYEASSADETVPSTYVTLVGGTAYNNFDTDAQLMYDYTADDAADVPSIVTGYYGAGRMNHGDLLWTFNTSTDDTDYGVSAALKLALQNYTTSLVGFFGDDAPDGGSTDTGNDSGNTDSGNTDSGDTGNDSGNSGDTGNTGDTVTEIEGSTVVTFNAFTNGTATINGVTITGNKKSGIAAKTYNGVTYTTALKIESSTSITFTTAAAAKLTLVLDKSGDIKVDGVAQTSDAEGIVRVDIAAGDHAITKSTSLNLYAIIITPAE